MVILPFHPTTSDYSKKSTMEALKHRQGDYPMTMTLIYWYHCHIIDDKRCKKIPVGLRIFYLPQDY